jgi:hypothetical protein
VFHTLRPVDRCFTIMDCIKSQNQCINAVVFPGSMAGSSYSLERYQYSAKFSLIFIPYKRSWTSMLSTCTAAPSYIPALLYANTSGKASRFCINFHGNACDISQISLCAEKEGRAFNAHYLLVEYPRFGIADGHPNEVTLNDVALSVYEFVTKEFQLCAADIVLLGRSIGTGPACELASHLQAVGTPPAALILQSPYSSIRDVTYDILGCVNLFLLDRWQSWRKLIGPETDPNVIRCPVLFIHADGDRVINCSHSQLMHEYRSKCALKSELFVQKSDSVFVKGHNYFDYDRDVLIPSADFLSRVSFETSNAQTPGASNESQNRPIVLPKDVVRQLTTVPEIYRHLPQAMETHQQGSVSLFKSPKCTWDVYAGWACCPCCFCTECCVAVVVNSATEATEYIPGCAPLFSYRRLRPADDPYRSTLWDVLFRHDEFKKNIKEEEAASSANQRLRQHHFHTQQFHRSLQRQGSSSTLGLSSHGNSTTTTNPLLAGSAVPPQAQQSMSGSSGYTVRQSQSQSQPRKSSEDYGASCGASGAFSVFEDSGVGGGKDCGVGNVLLHAARDGQHRLDYVPG